MSPVYFLLISLCLTSALLAFLFWIAWRSMGRQAHALTWCVAFGLVTLQRGLNLVSDRFSSFETYWTVVTALALVTVSLAVVGHRQRVGRSALWGELAVACAVVQAAVAWFTFAQPHVGLQMGLQPLHAGALALWIAAILYRHRPRPLLAELAAAAVHGTFGVLQSLAGVVALLQGPERDQGLFDLYLAINYLAMPAAYMGMALSMVLILASDLAEQMRELARTDPLTGLLNRRGFEEVAKRALGQAQRGRQPLAVIVTDIDRFKAVNDGFGHAVGDRALRVFAEELRRGRRRDDAVARLGGEEFAVLLPNADSREAVELAEEMRRALHRVDLEADGRRVELRASFGVAERVGTTSEVAALIDAADRALYQAKQGGRDQVRADGGRPGPRDERAIMRAER